MTRKLILFVVVFGLAAGSVVYSQQGTEPVPDPNAPNVIVVPPDANAPNVVVNRFIKPMRPAGLYGVLVTLQKRDGTSCAAPSGSKILTTKGWKVIDLVLVGDELGHPKPIQQ